MNNFEVYTEKETSEILNCDIKELLHWNIMGTLKPILIRNGYRYYSSDQIKNCDNRISNKLLLQKFEMENRISIYFNKLNLHFDQTLEKLQSIIQITLEVIENLNKFSFSEMEKRYGVTFLNSELNDLKNNQSSIENLNILDLEINSYLRASNIGNNEIDDINLEYMQKHDIYTPYGIEPFELTECLVLRKHLVKELYNLIFILLKRNNLIILCETYAIKNNNVSFNFSEFYTVLVYLNQLLSDYFSGKLAR